MNKVILMGRLTRDPKVTYSQGENSIPVARFSLAVDRRMKRDPNGEDTQTADFINCVAWRRQAENIAKYCTKGSQVAIEGRIQTGSYDGQDGTKRYTTDIVADNVTFLGSRGGNDMGFQPNEPFPQEPPMFQDNYATNETPTANVGEDPFKDFGEEIALSDDDLPF